MEESESMYEWGKKDNPEDEEKEGGGGNGEGGEGDEDGDKPKVKKVKPNMERSGKLQEEALKTESGVVLKFVDPPEAKRPSKKWRLYPFKGDQALGSCSCPACSLLPYGAQMLTVSRPCRVLSCGASWCRRDSGASHGDVSIWPGQSGTYLIRAHILLPRQEHTFVLLLKVNITDCSWWDNQQVAAIPTDHISCSKQHAALVHREINIKDELGIGPGRMVNK
jgi:hypothetical protein